MKFEVEKTNYNPAETLHLIVIACLALNLIVVSVSIVYNNTPSFEGYISSFRLLFSAVFISVIYKNLRPMAILESVFFLAIINSTLIIFQLIESLSDVIFLPEWLNYGYIYGLETSDQWRKGGLLPSLQTSSALSFFSLIYSANKYKRIFFVIFPFLIAPILFGARTFIVFLPLLFIYFLCIKQIKVIVWIPIFYYLLSDIPGFQSFVELRFGGLYNVLVDFDLRSDYSSEDMMRFYRIPNISEFLIGNGQYRYSEFGGGDPLYTRWLFQSGMFSLMLIIAPFLFCAIYLSKISYFYMLFFALFFFTSFKGEIFTSVGVFDVLYLLALSVIYFQKDNRLGGRGHNKQHSGLSFRGGLILTNLKSIT